MKKKSVLLVAFLSLFIFSCVNSRYFAKVPYNIKTSNKVLCKMPDIEIFPDYDYLYPKGDSICEGIINLGTDIIPCLIELITDTTQTQVFLSDNMRYKVGDAAVFLIEAIYAYDSTATSNRLSIPDIIRNKFFEKKDTPYFFLQEYQSYFLFNSEEENYKNRQKLQILLKEEIKKTVAPK